MAYNLGTARGIIEILYNSKGVKDAKKDVDELAGTTERGGKKMRAAGNVMGVAGAAIAGGLLAAVDQAAKFEQRVDVIGAVSGETGEIMERVRQKALQLGADTVFSAIESADAMGELVKAGLTVDEVLNGAADATVALAAAGEIDLTKAATIASNAMNQFNIKAQNMPHVADLIAGAANASAISVHQFGLSLSQVGAVANLVGFSFDDTATAIALLGDAGIRGSDAGTSLKTMFINLVPQTKPAIQMFEKLGLSQFNTARAMDLLRANGIKPLGKDMGTLNNQIVALSVKQSGAKVGTAAQTKAYAALAAETGVMANQFFDAQGKVKPMNEVFGTLAEATKNLTKEEKIKTLHTLFGTDAIRSSAIAAQLAAGGFNKMAADMKKVTAAQVAAERLNNLKGDIEKLKGSLQTAAIVIGTVLIPALRSVADVLTGLINKFNELDPSTQRNIAMIATWTAAILLSIAIIIRVVNAIKTFILVTKSAWAALKLLAAIIRLNGAMALLMARGGLAAAAAWVRATAASIAARASIIAHTAAMRISTAATAAWAAITSVLSVANLRAAASWVASTAAMVAHRAAMIAGAVATGIMTVAQGALSAVMALNPFVLVVIAIVALVAALILAYKKSETFRAIVDAVFSFLKNFITTTIKAIWAVIQVVWSAIAAVFKFYFNLYKTIAVTVWKFIVSVISNNIALVKAVISAAVNFIKSRWEAIKQLASIVSTVFTNIVNAIKQRISAVISAVTGIVTGILGKINSLRTSLIQAGRDAIQGLINGITGMAGAVLQKAKDLANSVKNSIKDALKISSPSRVMMDIGVEIPNGLIEGMERMRGRLASAAVDLASVPVGAIGGSFGGTVAPTSPAGTGVASGIVFEPGAVVVNAPAGMSASQVGEHTARRLGTALATRTQAPRIATAR